MMNLGASLNLVPLWTHFATPSMHMGVRTGHDLAGRLIFAAGAPGSWLRFDWPPKRHPGMRS